MNYRLARMALLLAVSAHAPTLAQQPMTWKSRVSISTLTSDSDQHACINTTPVVWTFSLNGDRLSVTSDAGTRTEAVVNPDGLVKHPFVSIGNRNLTLVGNARTKQLKIVNGKCTYGAPPL